MNSVEQKFHQYVARGYFSIDAEGHIWRLRTSRKGSKKGLTWLTLAEPRRAETQAGDYLAVQLYLWGRRRIVLAHRVVYQALKGSIPEGMLVNHNDGNKHYNHPDNLILATNQENTNHAKDVLGVGPWSRAPQHYGNRVILLVGKTKAAASRQATDYIIRNDNDRGLRTRIWQGGGYWNAGIYLPGD